MAENGIQALEFLKQYPVDIILMDVQMPVLNGIEATKIIRRIEKASGEHIPIIAMTAHAMKGDSEMCIKAGMDAYITKPIKRDRLVETVRELLCERKTGVKR